MGDNQVKDLVIQGIQFIRERRCRPSLKAILKFVKQENIDISVSDFKNAVTSLLADGKISKKSSAGKKDSFYINESKINSSIFDNSVDTTTGFNNDDTLQTPTKQFERSNQKDGTNAKSPAVNGRKLNEIVDSFIERRIIEEISPFTDRMEGMLEAYDELLKQHEKVINSNNILKENNQKLTMVEANVKKLEADIDFLKDELKAKNEIIKILSTTEAREPADPIKTCYKNGHNNGNSERHGEGDGYGNNDPYHEEFINPKKTFRYNNRALGNNFPITTENRYSVFNEEIKNTNRSGCNEQKQNDEYSRDMSGKHYHNKKRNNKRSITILGTSIIKDIKPYKMNKSLEPGSKIYVKSFSGAKVSCMRDHVRPSLRYNPDLIILGAGANDLKSEKTPEMISDEIINLASDMKSDTNEIMVSGIVPRNDDASLHEKGERVNELTREMCHSKGLGYVDNSNIDPNKHLNGSGVHLNYHGTSILVKNFLNAIKI